MENRAVGFIEIPVTGDTLQLPPGLAAGMAIRADVAPSEPAVIGAIRIGTEVSVSIDGAPAASRKGEHGRWRPWRLRVHISSMLTGLAERFVDQSRKGFGGLGALASGRVRLEKRP